jgi:hypothetical protein
VERVVAIENKPDLDRRAADALADQLERDVALALADEAWVATRAAGDRVEPALLEDLPVEAGVLAFDGGEPTVAWHPAALDPGLPGTRILDRPGGGPRDRSPARFEYVAPEEKALARLVVAERVYGRGWRSYADTMRPDCRHFDAKRAAAGGAPAYIPTCRAKCREQTAAECSGGCPEFSPEPPAWRQHGWPVEGGPGNGVTRVLADRRARRRPGLDGEL